MMNAVEPNSSGSEADSAQHGTAQDGEDPQQTRPQKPAAFFSSLKRLLRLGRDTSNLRENLEDELAREGAGDTAFSPEERMLLGNILRLREKRVDDVMIPRADIEAVDIGTSLSRVMELFRNSGHSRMPVYEDTLDDPRGMVHIKDLMAFIAEQGAGSSVNGSDSLPPSEDTERLTIVAPAPGHNSSDWICRRSICRFRSGM
jgi:CBS domain containing-hemolysin-like protein